MANEGGGEGVWNSPNQANVINGPPLRIQADCLHIFKSIPAFILPQTEYISATIGHGVATFCMSATFSILLLVYNLGYTTSKVDKLKEGVF